ncbi:MAG: epoxide hydrolase family protein [Thermoanaerobaculia bacterium]
MTIRPFRAETPEAALSDLRDRLARTRWPDTAAGDWEEGPPAAYLRELADYWRARFDWRRVEERINALPNFTASIDGRTIHFVHLRGRRPSLFPIVLTHGWPGSFLELLEIAELLSDAFDVVVPSLPGYGYSEPPGETGIDPLSIAALWGKLMSGLGYERFGAQGGDWGATIATHLALAFPERVAAIHLNYIPGSYAPYLGPGSRPLSPSEEKFVAERDLWREEEGAYGHLQATRPRTPAYALTDSPVGLLAWIVEKFRSWSDCGGDLESRFSKDALLANVTLYWLTQTIGSSMRLYRGARAVPLALGPGERVSVPCGVARFPKEAPMPPREWVERGYDVVRWTEMPRGGHFAAMEEPELLAADVREFFRPLRSGAAATR